MNSTHLMATVLKKLVESVWRSKNPFTKTIYFLLSFLLHCRINRSINSISEMFMDKEMKREDCKLCLPGLLFLDYFETILISILTVIDVLGYLKQLEII